MDISAWWNSLDSLLRVLYAIAISASCILTIQIILILIGLSHASGTPDAGDMGGAHPGDLNHSGFNLDGVHHASLDVGGLHQGDLSAGDASGALQDFSGVDAPRQDFAPSHQDASPTAHSDAGALHLLSISGIVSFFTVFGWSAIILYQNGLPGAVAVPVGLGLGYVAMYGAAKLVQFTVRLSEDGSMRLDNALGEPALVYIPIPASGVGEGKVTLTLQEQFVELSAVTDEDKPISCGETVTVVGVRDGALVVKHTIKSIDQ